MIKADNPVSPLLIRIATINLLHQQPFPEIIRFATAAVQRLQQREAL